MALDIKLMASRGGAGHGAHLGIRYVAHGEAWVELAIDHDPRLTVDAAIGIFASGPIVALMDSATGLACMARRGEIEPMATLDLRIDYLRPSLPGLTIFGRGECYRLTRHIAFARGQAHDGDPNDPVAHVAATFMFTGEEGTP